MHWKNLQKEVLKKGANHWLFHYTTSMYKTENFTLRTLTFIHYRDYGDGERKISGRFLICICSNTVLTLFWKR